MEQEVKRLNTLMQLIDQYGYIVLFFSLMLELIIIPIPNELLMSYVGFLVYQGKFNLYLTILVGGIGGLIGVTISYWIGNKLGAPFFNKYGYRIHLGPDKIERVSKWNEKYGKGLLIFCYFIPGVRHVTSLFSGITKVPFKSFATFAYIGVFLWVGTFISLGNIFGPQWSKFHQEAKVFVVIGCLLIAGIYCLYLLIKTNKQKLTENTLLLFEHAFKRFHSFLKIKILIFFIGIIFIGLFSLMIGIIQDFIANEFDQFNDITSTIIAYTFNQTWGHVMDQLIILTAWQTLIAIGLLTLIWIMTKGKNKRLEIQYYLIGIIGAIIFGKGLHILFSQITVGKMVSKAFPSEQTLIGIVIFGFFMYAFIRHCKSFILNVVVIILDLFCLLSIAISRIYLGLQDPSDLVAGFVFGGVWTSFIILLIEGSRLLNYIKLSLNK